MNAIIISVFLALRLVCGFSMGPVMQAMGQDYPVIEEEAVVEWAPPEEDIIYISRTIWGEARGCCQLEREAAVSSNERPWPGAFLTGWILQSFRTPSKKLLRLRTSSMDILRMFHIRISTAKQKTCLSGTTMERGASIPLSYISPETVSTTPLGMSTRYLKQLCSGLRSRGIFTHAHRTTRRTMHKLLQKHLHGSV